MRKMLIRFGLILFALVMAESYALAGPTLLARGTLTGSSAGYYTDLSGLTDTLENGVSASLLGGIGFGLGVGRRKHFHCHTGSRPQCCQL